MSRPLCNFPIATWSWKSMRPTGVEPQQPSQCCKFRSTVCLLYYRLFGVFFCLWLKMIFWDISVQTILNIDFCHHVQMECSCFFLPCSLSKTYIYIRQSQSCFKMMMMMMMMMILVSKGCQVEPTCIGIASRSQGPSKRSPKFQLQSGMLRRFIRY